MKKIKAIVIITFFAVAAFAQSTNTFPQSFVGKWKGSLQWIVAGKPTQTFTMQLHIMPTDTAGVYTWQIIYGDDAKDNRPYLLKPFDAIKGHWVVDEKDGIVLDGYVFGNTYTGAFTVQNNTIVDTYRVENDTMFVAFVSMNLNAKNTSGKGTDEVPTVTSYKIGSYQQGILRKLP